MGDFTTSQGVQWTPPGAAANSGNSTLTTSGTENAQSVGSLDIPSGTASGTEFPIPFGSVGAAKVCIIENKMTTEVGLRLNGAGADIITLGPGQRFSVEGSVAGSGTPLTSASIVTTADPTSTEKVNFWVLGD